MRIAIFSEVFLPKVDGITNRLKNTVQELVKAGDEVLIFAPGTSVRSFAGCKVVRIKSMPFPPYPEVKMTWPNPKILYHLSKFKPDVVHAVGPVCLGLWGITSARMLNLPIVASYHTDFPKYMPLYGLGGMVSYAWQIMRGIHNRAVVNLCPSKHTKNELEEQGIKNVGIWRGGVDTELFHPKRKNNSFRSMVTGGKNKPILMYAGRLGYEKNIDHLRLLHDHVKDFQLVIVGDGPARGFLEETFKGTDTYFTGYLRGESLATAFAGADLFMMPSTTETLGFVSLEAMSSGLPVIAANAGGTRDLVDPDKTGYLYDPEDRMQMVDYVNKVLGSASLRQQLAENARSSALKGTWREETDKLRKTYRKAIYSFLAFKNDLVKNKSNATSNVSLSTSAP